MADLQNATIEIIEEVKTTKGKYGLTKKIKGKNIETGQTNTYTLYDKKADGTTSKAWTDYPGIGATVAIGFATKEGNLEDGTPYTQRIIRNFDLDIGNGVKNRVANPPAPAQKSRPGANSEATEPFKQGTDEFSRRLGVQGHVNALLSNPNVVIGSETSTLILEQIVRKAIAVEDEINRQLNSKSKSGYEKFKQSGESLPVIQQEDEAPPFTDEGVEGVPF